jgi:hypothetical protein
MGFRKDHRPEVLGSDHQDAGHEEVVIFVLTGALNLLLEALTLMVAIATIFRLTLYPR